MQKLTSITANAMRSRPPIFLKHLKKQSLSYRNKKGMSLLERRQLKNSDSAQPQDGGVMDNGLALRKTAESECKM